MDLKIPYKFAKELLKHPEYIKTLNPDKTVETYKAAVSRGLALLNSRFKNQFYRNYADTDEIELEAYLLGETLTAHLLKLAKANTDFKPSNYLIQQLNQWNNTNTNPDGTDILTVKGLKSAMEAYVSKSKNRLLFKMGRDGALLPYLVDKLEYRKQHQEDNEKIYASCKLILKYAELGEIKEESEMWFNDKLKAKKAGGKNVTVPSLIAERGYMLETPELLAQYNEQTKVFDTLRNDVGTQCLAVGHGRKYKINKADDSWAYWRDDNIWFPLEIEGGKSVVVVDVPTMEEAEKGKSEGRRLWFAEWDRDDIEEDTNLDVLPIPDHPYVICYHMGRHMHMSIHISNLQRYVYNPGLKDKLVLPQDTVDILDILVGSEGDIMGDIVQGKSGGIIIGATGDPGVGKTLTAEIYSEIMHKPLYKIQSSQLGVDVKELEKNLITVLLRAARWKAILLIDEADVFIYKRENDLVRNAVVGTFLRVLETYTGVLFLTSNRGDDIDDAIKSRFTAHIRYKTPPRSDLKLIWGKLASHYEVKISESVIEELVNEFPKMSGRDVKESLKLMRLIIKKDTKKKVNVELMRHIAKFKDINTNKD